MPGKIANPGYARALKFRRVFCACSVQYKREAEFDNSRALSFADASQLTWHHQWHNNYCSCRWHRKYTSALGFTGTTNASMQSVTPGINSTVVTSARRRSWLLRDRQTSSSRWKTGNLSCGCNSPCDEVKREAMQRLAFCSTTTMAQLHRDEGEDGQQV